MYGGAAAREGDSLDGDRARVRARQRGRDVGGVRGGDLGRDLGSSAQVYSERRYTSWKV